MTATTIPIDSVIVSDRARTQIGGSDLTVLSESLAEHGLLHPIVIDADNRLVAGGRRLRAAKDLGWLEIEATRLGELTDRERKIIELEENIRRVDLRDVDRSRLVAQIADLAEQVIAEEGVLFQDETEVRIGRPDRPGSVRDVAERIGKSPATITRARQHIAAVDADPSLAGKSQADVLKTVTKARKPSRANADETGTPKTGAGVERSERTGDDDDDLYEVDRLMKSLPKLVDGLTPFQGLHMRQVITLLAVSPDHLRVVGQALQDRYEREAPFWEYFEEKVARRRRGDAPRPNPDWYDEWNLFGIPDPKDMDDLYPEGLRVK